MDRRGYQQYKQQSVNSMTPGELLLLLYDELVKRLMQAELALGKENYPLFVASVGRSLEIIRYLDDTLDRQYPISGNLAKLYEFFSYELQRVKAGRNKTELERVKKMASELRDTFREAQKNVEAMERSPEAAHAPEAAGAVK